MIKKAGIVFLVLMYVITSTGFALNLHYCGNHIADIKINAPVKSCIKLTFKRNMKCCKDTKLDVKVKDSHESQPNSVLTKITPVAVSRSAFEDFILPVHQLLLDVFFDHGPPNIPKQNVSTIIKNRSLKI